MNYEQKYKETLERAKTLYENANGMILKKWVEQVFPELKESEDERIRKWLEETIEGMSENSLDFRDVRRIDVLHWLEKQSKKEEYVLKSSKNEDILKFVKYIEKEAKAYDFNLPNRGYDIYGFAKDILTWLEKQGEQKPVIDIDIPFGAKDSELIEASYYIPEGFHAEIEGNNVVIKKGEQKLNWTDEDEKNFNNIDIILFEYKNLPKENYWKIINWIKSIKQRMEEKQ